MAAVLREEQFQATDGAQLFVRTWVPKVEGSSLRAVVHVQHGLSDHGGRYAGLAETFAAAGFSVVVHDARGHGRTSQLERSLGLGRVACGNEGAVMRMATDLGELINATRAKRPSVPIFLLGHSFGTVISRVLLCSSPPAALSGVVLISPPSPLIAPMVPVFRALMGGLHAVNGDSGVSSIPTQLTFGKYQKQIMKVVKHQGPVTGFEWLNRDSTEVKGFVDDPMCGQLFNMGFWSAAAPALISMGYASTYAKWPEKLPFCVFAGEHDFATKDELGVRSYTRLQELLTRAGKATPKVVVYPKARHDLIVEVNKEEVLADVLSFLSLTLDARASLAEVTV